MHAIGKEHNLRAQYEPMYIYWELKTSGSLDLKSQDNAVQPKEITTCALSIHSCYLSALLSEL